MRHAGPGTHHDATDRRPLRPGKTTPRKAEDWAPSPPQICTEGERTGNTIVYAAIESEIPKEFATDLHGQLLPYEKYCKERDRRAAQEAEDAKLSTSDLQD